MKHAVRFLLAFILLQQSTATSFDPKISARAVVFKNENFADGQTIFDSTPLGHIDFIQEPTCVRIKGSLYGLSPGLHGFHVHQLGDIYSGCSAAGGHFNPTNHNHSAPWEWKRHVGDLGNVEADTNGVANIDMYDKIVQLQGEHSVIGRSVVVHEGVDDMGKGGHPESLTTGNAGGRLGCGVIGVVSEG